jgi:membrane protein YdbS with pleckstrin-like domain
VSPLVRWGSVGFVRNVLDDNEEVLAELRPHVVYLVPPLLVVTLAVAIAVTVALRFPGAPVAVAWVLGAMVLLPVLWAVARLLRWRAIRFLVTDTRLVYRRGVFGRDVVQLRLQRVAEVHCTQSILGRIIGCGRLVFEVATGDGPLVVDDVPRPRAVQRLITRTLDEMEPGYGQARRTMPAAVPGYGSTQAVPAYAPAPRRTWSDTPPHGVASHSAPGGPGALDGPVGPGGLGAGEFTPASVPGRLVQLDELRRRGIISEAEFAAKKAELLHRL